MFLKNYFRWILDNVKKKQWLILKYEHTFLAPMCMLLSVYMNVFKYCSMPMPWKIFRWIIIWCIISDVFVIYLIIFHCIKLNSLRKIFQLWIWKWYYNNNHRWSKSILDLFDFIVMKINKLSPKSYVLIRECAID